MRYRPRAREWAVLISMAMVLPLHAQAGDPPGVVAWLSEATGAVSVLPAGTDTWLDTSTNRPLTAGGRVWVDQGARAEMHIGSMAIRLGSQTNLSFQSLNDDLIQITLTQGMLSLRINAEAPGQRVELDTPNLALVPNQTGIYRVDVPAGEPTTAIKVLDGQATVYSRANRNGNTVYSGERVVYTDADASQYVRENNSAVDSFDIWSAGRDQIDAQSVSAHYVSREMMGYQALDAHGTWVDEPNLGPVWVPRDVGPDWAPYSDGRWEWIAPWGWTWVDAAPWGFAPCHYGRWAWATSRWVWVPGARMARPVYAPALVAFIADRNNHGSTARVTLSNGLSGIAWIPLGPGETYRPTFHASPRYITLINQTVIVKNRDVYVNAHAPHAISAVPIETFAHGRPVHAIDNSLHADSLQGARVVHTVDVAPAYQHQPRSFPSAPVATAPAASTKQMGVHEHEAPSTTQVTVQPVAVAPRPHQTSQSTSSPVKPIDHSPVMTHPSKMPTVHHEIANGLQKMLMPTTRPTIVPKLPRAPLRAAPPSPPQTPANPARARPEQHGGKPAHEPTKHSTDQAH